MSERQGNLIIALLCLNFAYDAIKIMITMYYDRQDRMELNYRLDRLEEFLVQKTGAQCSCDCCHEDEELEEEGEEEAEEEEAEEAEEEGEEAEEAEEETEEAEEDTQEEEEEGVEEEEFQEEDTTFIADDGAVYAFKISLNTIDETRTVEKIVEDSPPQ
jgi:chemotaxis protein histidine kinase CheA